MQMDRLTTTIKRPWLAEIIAGTKKIEYREIKPYWRDRLAQVEVPFELRLINGMHRRAPEVTALINKVKKDTRNGAYELHIRKVISFMNWDHSRSVRR
jgi:hypothetical protein